MTVRHACHESQSESWSNTGPWDVTGDQMVPPGVPDAIREQLLAFTEAREAHVAVHVLDSQTQAYGLNDSPVGMLAWLLERWRAWGDHDGDVASVFTKDERIHRRHPRDLPAAASKRLSRLDTRHTDGRHDGRVRCRRLKCLDR